MPVKTEIKPRIFFELRYAPDGEGGSGYCAIRISELMKKMGLKEGDHYDVKPFENPDSELGKYLKFVGGVSLLIYSNPFWILQGEVGGFSLVKDYLERNEKTIREGLGRLNLIRRSYNLKKEVKDTSSLDEKLSKLI